MNLPTSRYLCMILGHVLEKMDTDMRKCIPINPYNFFNIVTNRNCYYFDNVCWFIWNNIYYCFSQYKRMFWSYWKLCEAFGFEKPTLARIPKIASYCKDLYDILYNMLEAIDGSHVPINAPPWDLTPYCCRKEPLW